jgi:hypothetical protein
LLKQLHVGDRHVQMLNDQVEPCTNLARLVIACHISAHRVE